MGTNYYLEQDVCEHCGRADDQLHIGKSSDGWCFSLHVIPDKWINNLDDWVEFWVKPGTVIKDEYGAQISPKDMLDIITKRSWSCPSKEFDYERNHAEPGPNNLVRHVVDDRFCVGHGDGTWDLMEGEFC